MSVVNAREEDAGKYTIFRSVFSGGLFNESTRVECAREIPRLVLQKILFGSEKLNSNILREVPERN
mgnify:CR=1 FL=1